MTRRRWLRIGAALSVLGIVIGAAIALAFPHGYGGGTVRVRSWLVVLSCAIAVPSMLGAACMAKAAPWPLIQWLFGGAALVWLAHAVLLGALIDRPLAADSGWITVLTVLVCLPSLLRALALWTSHYGRLLAFVDLIIVLSFWVQTPIEVIARAHVAQMTTWAVIPGALTLMVVGMYSDA